MNGRLLLSLYENSDYRLQTWRIAVPHLFLLKLNVFFSIVQQMSISHKRETFCYDCKTMVIKSQTRSFKGTADLRKLTNLLTGFLVFERRLCLSNLLDFVMLINILFRPSFCPQQHCRSNERDLFSAYVREDSNLALLLSTCTRESLSLSFVHLL